MIATKISNDQKQRDQALNIHDSFIVQAPAGSGKTELLAQRYLSLLGKASQPENILAMTFTNKAAAELKNRILQYFNDAISKPPKEPYKLKTFELANKALAQSQKQGWDLLGNPARIKISTIDSLSSLIVAKYPSVESLMPPRIMADKYEYEDLYQSAAESTFQLLEEPEYQDIIKSVLLYLDNDVEKFYRLLLQMLAKREQWLPRLYKKGAIEIEILKQTAQNIISEHLLHLEAIATIDFDESFFEPLKEHNSTPSKLPKPNIESLEIWLKLAKLCLTSNGQWRKTVDKRQGFTPELKEQKKDFIAILEKLNPRDDLREALFDLTLLPEPFHSKEDHKILQDISQILKLAVAQLKLLFESHNVIDFAELGLIAADKLGSLENVSDIALFLDYKIEHLLIDEFQDTSYTQFSLIEKLITNWQEDSGRTLFLVGDPMQSIYRFRESEVGIFLYVKKNGIADVRLKYLQLNSNFRSIKSIVESNNDYFANIFPAQDNVANGAISYAPSLTASEHEIDNAVSFYPFLSNADQQEAIQVCEIIKKTLAENASDEIAILVKSRSHLNEIITALQLNGIDYEAVKTNTLRAHLFTRDLLILTRALLCLGDKLAWLALLRSPWCGFLLKDLLILSESDTMTIYHQLIDDDLIKMLSDESLQRVKIVRNILSEAIANEGRFSFIERFSCALNKLSPQEYLDAEKRSIKSQFLAILSSCEAVDNVELKSIESMLAELYAPSHTAQVKLMTIYQAKGLEFDVVIMPGLGKRGKSDSKPLIRLKALPNNSLLLAPIESAFAKNETQTYSYLKELDKKQNRFEMMRLLYVAMSRAKKRTHILGHVNDKGEAGKNTLLNFILPFFKDSMLIPEYAPEQQTKTVQAPSLSRYQNLPSIKGFSANTQQSVSKSPKGLDLIYQKALGIVVHHFLEHEIFAPDVQSIDTRLLQLGVPSNLRKIYNEKTQKLLNNAKNDLVFDWLFKKRQSTQVEAEFGNAQKSIIIDRLFIDEGTLWVVDFKTLSLAPQESKEAFIERVKKQHQEQLYQYRSILENVFKMPTKTAIYCPAIPQLIYL